MAGKRSSAHDVTPERLAKFLEALTEAYTINEAAKIAGVSRSWIYTVRERDEDFAKAWDDAYQAGTESLEATARKRATDPKKGSDILLMFLMKKRDPSYRESFKHEVGGPGGGPIQIQRIERVIVDPENRDP